jgi:hypothetical protein
MCGMAEQPTDKNHDTAPAVPEIPDRLCTWCKIPMLKRLVGGNLYVHYTCPQCVFQHTAKRQPKER